MTTATLQPRLSNVWWVFLLQGIAGILLGFMLLTDPHETLVVLVTFLGFYCLIKGVLGLMQVFETPSTGWRWSWCTSSWPARFHGSGRSSAGS